MENFVHKKRMSKLSVDYFCLTVPKNFGRGGRREPSKVLENFGYWNLLCIRRSYHFSPLKILGLTVLKIFAGYPSVFQTFPVSKIFMHRKRGRASRYCEKKVMSHRIEEKNFVRYCLLLQKYLVATNFLWVRNAKKRMKNDNAAQWNR